MNDTLRTHAGPRWPMRVRRPRTRSDSESTKPGARAGVLAEHSRNLSGIGRSRPEPERDGSGFRQDTRATQDAKPGPGARDTIAKWLESAGRGRSDRSRHSGGGRIVPDESSSRRVLGGRNPTWSSLRTVGTASTSQPRTSSIQVCDAAFACHEPGLASPGKNTGIRFWVSGSRRSSHREEQLLDLQRAAKQSFSRASKWTSPSPQAGHVAKALMLLRALSNSLSKPSSRSTTSLALCTGSRSPLFS